MAQQNPNIQQNSNSAQVGMNMDSSISQLKSSQWTYSLNGTIENFDGNGISIQNELGNKLCLTFPEGYKYIGGHFIPERRKHIFFLCDDGGNSEIGYMEHNDCVYRTIVNDPCLGFSINFPILKVAHKVTNCSTEIYWTDANTPRRWMDIDNVPYISTVGDTVCDTVTGTRLDCNKLKVQPNFSIPKLEVTDVISGGSNIAGTYQFAFQYCDVEGNGYTSYYSVTNPTPLFDPKKITLDFNYPVDKSIILDISEIDVAGTYKYFNVAVIRTVNNITSVQLVGTYTIDARTKQITYSGQNVTAINLTVDDIFEKFPYYNIAGDLTTVQDVLVWDQLTAIDRINYQKIANKIQLQWESYRIPSTESYGDEINATNLRGYLRDEVYPFEINFLLTNGKQTDSFHIPGRAARFYDKTSISSTNNDFIGEGTNTERWKVYNTASVTGTSGEYSTKDTYKGPYQYGEFSYWESTETYPCNEDQWGDLAGQPIRHHKFPDCLVSPHFESSEYTSSSITPIQEDRAIYALGIKFNVAIIEQLISQSDLTQEQKDAIVGFKIIRGDRATNKSVIAKGIFRNVGKYTRDSQGADNPTYYYFPNYPYNDLREDPFLLEQNNWYNPQCITYKLTGVDTTATYIYTDCIDNIVKKGTIKIDQVITICSSSFPDTTATVEITSFDTYVLINPEKKHSTTVSYINPYSYASETVIVTAGNHKSIEVKPGTVPHYVSGATSIGIFKTKSSTGISEYKPNQTCYPSNLDAFTEDASKYRHVFNSPETSFTNPFLGNTVKLENVIFGAGSAHFVQVKDNAKYKLLTKAIQEKALDSASAIAAETATFDWSILFTAYSAYLAIYTNQAARINYGWSYNSIASYNYLANIPNDLGIKQRNLDISTYLIPGVQSVGDDLNVNNFNRESSIYLKTSATKLPFSFPKDIPALVSSGNSIIEDKSRYIASQQNCYYPENEFDISVVSYYGAIKNSNPNQWGQIYSYNTLDTGFQTMFSEGLGEVTVFGGDTFISKFAFKTKLPFFIDNRVNAVDDSDIFFDEIGNIAFPQYWYSSRNVSYDYDNSYIQGDTKLKGIINVKAHVLDCSADTVGQLDTSTTTPSTTTTTTTGETTVTSVDDTLVYNGKMYLFAYGIPSFYCESGINLDLRQAFNYKEGEFFPHVQSGIPDKWLQESNVTIAQDNTYYYNATYSKQNKENEFSHLPIDWANQLCFTTYPFRAIYSDPQQSFTDNRVNSWLIYRPISYFDFPQNFGDLISLDGIQNKAVLARFENRTQLYNALLTIDTSNPQAAYLGNSSLFRSSPPIDYADTDLGFMGSQHKFLLKVPQGQITIDAKRGQIFLIQGQQATEISGFNSGMNRFLTANLDFKILDYFPAVNIDNHFNGIGLHGVYDSNYDRIIITKLDYIPLSSDIKYDETEKIFYINEYITANPIKKQVFVTNSDYFCDKSWTLSYNLNTNSWISFHSYLPNFYIGESNFFYSGLNESCDIDAIATIIKDCKLEGEVAILPTYTYKRYDFNSYSCSHSNPVLYWSLNSYSSGYYNLNGDLLTTYYLAPFTHTTFTNEITSVVSVAACVPPPCTLTVTSVDVTDTTSPGGTDGTITIHISGATGPIEYYLSLGGPVIGPQVSNIFTGLSAGSYDAYAYETTFSCAAYLPATISDPSCTLAGTAVQQ